MSSWQRIGLAAACVVIMTLAGCLMLYDGSIEGIPKVVAMRDEPGQPREEILQVGGKAYWDVIVGPDGPGKTHFNSVRYYIAAGSKTNGLSHATKWAYADEEIEGAIPIRGTDRWMLAYAKITSGDTVTLDVRLFTAHKLIAQHEIEEALRDAERDDLSGYGVCVVSADGRTITIPTVEGDCVLNGVTGELTRPTPAPDIVSNAHVITPLKGISLYDIATDRILWTVPDEYILSSRTDTNTFITCTSSGRRRILRLRDGAGVELVRREVVCVDRHEMAASPNLKRAAYLVNPNGGELESSGYGVRRAAALCVETFGESGSTKRNVFDVGEERDLEFEWITDDVLIGTWRKHLTDYNHYDYVVIDARTGKWRVLPFETDYFRGFDVDIAAGKAYLRGRIYDAKSDTVTATLDFSNPAWPQDQKGFRGAGIENGVGIVFNGMFRWMLVGWDGKLVASGNLQRKGIASVNRAIGHGRLVVWLKENRSGVLLLKENRIIKGCTCMPSPDGKLLIGSPLKW